MTSAVLEDFLGSLAVLSVFLLIGTFLRAKLKIFQKTFIPASVIGGFLLLLLGPIVSGVLPIPDSWISTYSALPGVLIVPIVAAVPLGIRFGGGGKGGKKNRIVLPLFFLMSFAAAFQILIGFLTNAAAGLKYEMYPAFGVELLAGFCGGHGTAGLVGNALQSRGLPYWELSQGVCVTTATFGLVGGILLGILLINWAARKGYTSILKKPGDIPDTFKVGYIKDPKQQGPLCKETTLPASIDTLAFHLALILTVCGVSYLILNLLTKSGIPVLKDISVWAYALLLMFLVWWLMCKLKIDYLVDSKAKSRITGAMTDYAVIAAIASLPIQAVASYIVPIIIMCVIGLAVTAAIFLLAGRRYLRSNWFEHAIASFGMASGVFLTGILLLRICDPEGESEVLGNYSMAYVFFSLLNFALLSFYLSIILTKGVPGVLLVGGLVAIISFAGLLLSGRRRAGD